MTSPAAEMRVRSYAKRLRLPVVADSAVRYAEEAAAEGHGALEFLAALFEAEVAQRDTNMEKARIAAAHFPEVKELADFNFSLIPSLNASLITDLARGSWIDRHEVVMAVGPPGTGKTHTAIALGVAACRMGKRVRFVTAAALVTELAEAQAQHRLSRFEAQLDRIDLLICDELGFIRLDADQAQLLFILLAHRYTRGALILTSNLEFGDWPSVFNDDTRMTAALLDRLTHRCHLLPFQGQSFRFRESLSRRPRSRATSRATPVSDDTATTGTTKGDPS